MGRGAEVHQPLRRRCGNMTAQENNEFGMETTGAQRCHVGLYGAAESGNWQAMTRNDESHAGNKPVPHNIEVTGPAANEIDTIQKDVEYNVTTIFSGIEATGQPASLLNSHG